MANITDNDLRYVMTHLQVCCGSIPESFVPDMGSTVPPVQPPSMTSQFLNNDSNPPEWSGWFNRYNQETKEWAPDPQGVIPPDLKAAVAAAQERQDCYFKDVEEYRRAFDVQRDMQWRKVLGEAIIAATA